MARNDGFTIYLLGSTKVDGKEYGMPDLKPGSLKPPTDHGLADSFYGGRCKWIGETISDVHLVIEDASPLRVIDTFVKRVDNLQLKTLKMLAARQGIDTGNAKTKDDFIQLLGGRNTARPAKTPVVERIE